MTSFMRPAVAALLVLCGVTSPARSRADETPVHKDATSRASAVPQGTPSYFSGVPGKPRDFSMVYPTRTLSPARAQIEIKMSDGSIVLKPAPRLKTPSLPPPPPPPPTSDPPLCAAPFDQLQPVVVRDGGGYFVAWTDYRYGTYDIFAQQLNGGGVTQWVSNGMPVVRGAGFQSAPQVVSDGLGGALFFWQDDRNGNLDIYGQRLSTTGVPLWGPNGIAICTAVGDQRLGSVIPDGTAGAILCWEDDRGGATATDIYVQRVSNSGTALWTAGGLVVGAAAGTQQLPVLVSDGLYGAIVAWQDNRGANQDVYAQRVSGAGSALWTANGVSLCNATGNQGSASICGDGAGGAIVSWDDARTPANGLDVYAQRVNASGTVQWTANGVALVSMPGDQRKPKVASDGAGGVVAAWQDLRGGATSDVYARRVDATGTPMWTANGVPVCTAATDQFDVAVKADGGGGMFVVWTDARDSGTNGTDIYGQKLNSSGTALWTANGVALCNNSGNQDQPTVEADGGGGAFAAWRDFRNGTNSDIYYQRVDSGGNLPDQCGTPVDLLSGTSVTTTGVTNNYSFFQNDVVWTAIGVRGASGDDWDMEVYGPESFVHAQYPVCFGEPVVGSYQGPGVVDFVIGDFNGNHVPTGVYQARAFRAAGSGAAAVEWDDGAVDTGSNPDLLDPSANQLQNRTTDATDVLECWDLYGIPGHTYTIQFRRTGGTAETRVLLFQALGSVGCSPTDCFYMVPRSARVMEAQHDFIFTPPDTDWYGVVVVNDNGQSGTYDIGVKVGVQSTGVGESPLAATGLKGMVPNPAKGSMKIQFALGKAGNVSFQVFDIGGRVVSSIPAKDWAPGSWSVAWNGRQGNGQRVLPGLYFLQMKVDDRVVGLNRVTLLN